MERPDPTIPSADDAYRADRVLVHSALQGNKTAQEVLIDRLACVPAMLRSRNRRLGNPLGHEEVEDAIQETLSAIWMKLQGYEGRARIETWAFRFAMYEFAKGLQRRRRHSRHESLEASDVEQWQAQPERQPEIEPSSVQMALERVGSESAQVVRLKHFDELTFEAIATRLAVSPNTVKARYYRALERLRDHLEPRRRKEES